MNTTKVDGTDHAARRILFALVWVFIGTCFSLSLFLDHFPRWQRLDLPVGIFASLLTLWIAKRLKNKEYRFELRHLLVLTFCCAAMLGLWRIEYRRLAKRDELHDRIRDMGGHVFIRWHRVDLSRTKITDAQLKGIASELGGLILFTTSELLVSDTNLGNDSIESLAQIGSLTVLAMANTRVTDGGLRDLSELTKLESLNLRGTRVGDEGVRHLCKLSRLEMLSLADTMITDEGLAWLKTLKRLEYLKLDGAVITDDGLAHVAEFPNLRTLSIRRTRISDIGLSHLSKNDKLRLVDVRDTRVTGRGLKEARLRLPKTTFLGDEEGN